MEGVVCFSIIKYNVLVYIYLKKKEKEKKRKLFSKHNFFL